MRGWADQPMVRGLLDGLSRLHGAPLVALEMGPGADGLAPPRPDMMREIIVGEAPVGWVAVEGEPTIGDRHEAVLEQAASMLAAQVKTLGELESLRSEVAETYEELNLLYNLSDALGSRRDEKEICAAVLEQAQRVIGGARCSILLLDEAHGVLRLAAQCNLPDEPGARAPIPRDQGISGFVLNTRRALVAESLADLPAEVSRGADGLPPDHQLVMPPLLSVPMRSRGQVVGVINLSMKSIGRAFTSHDLKLAQALASEAAVFIEVTRFIAQVRHGERLKSELEIARTIQQGLLPRREPIIPGVDVAGLCRPASDVGGDYYGFIEEAVPGVTGLAIMDVAGHNVGAAVGMASTRSILRCEARARRSSREVIERVNDLVCQDLEDGGMYATLFYALYEHATGELRYTNAGHPSPLLLKTSEQRCRRLAMGGMAVGICPGQSYREETVRLAAGDLLLLYTDGLTEARNAAQEMFGEIRLAQAVGKYRHATAWEIVSALLGEVNAFVGGASQADDIALIAMKSISAMRNEAEARSR